MADRETRGLSCWRRVGPRVMVSKWNWVALFLVVVVVVVAWTLAMRRCTGWTSSGLQIRMLEPEAPARAVRPERCT